MKDAYEVLRLKEAELAKVKDEVEALGIVAPLLSDEGDLGVDSTPTSTRWTAPPRPIQVPKGAKTDPQPEHAPEWKTRTAGFP
jgi:hypothetical protein